jgi:outer membrane protein assembly factor BamB
VCCAIFSNTNLNLIFVASKHATVQLDVANSSVKKFNGFSGDHECCGDAMALSDDGNTLYVGYSSGHCVIAYDVPTRQKLWKASLKTEVASVSYHAGLLLVGVTGSYFLVLNAADGKVRRKFDVNLDGSCFGHALITGLSEVSLRVDDMDNDDD